MSLLCLCIWNDDGCICGTLYNRISSTHIVIVFIFNIITNQTHLEDDVQLVVVGFSIQPNLNPVQHPFQIFLLFLVGEIFNRTYPISISFNPIQPSSLVSKFLRHNPCLFNLILLGFQLCIQIALDFCIYLIVVSLQQIVRFYICDGRLNLFQVLHQTIGFLISQFSLCLRLTSKLGFQDLPLNLSFKMDELETVSITKSHTNLSVMGILRKRNIEQPCSRLFLVSIFDQQVESIFPLP